MAKGLDCGTTYYIAATDKSIKKQRTISGFMPLETKKTENF